ncbi:DEAD/DEAH box helicase family protein [Bhargavaea beijingensis]|nr:DEAD/DEAH box helicase family protein [Bhargavaea beijingensis]
MERFPEMMKFCHPWRSYQKEVLSELDRHLENGHLHLVAPPGSGKTVLGLEVMRRIGRRTLIVAPTIALREQWADRLTELFLEGVRPDWLSSDLSSPGFVTVTTYQSLHALFKSGGEGRLLAEGFGAIVLDEAHHLRTSWWKTMMDIKEGLENPAVVALTATPPYDESPAGWQRYVSLCGPIDLEIPVASLVKAGDLCPHQDYIRFTVPSAEELSEILAFRERTDEFLDELREDGEFVRYLEQHRWIAETEAHVEEILGLSAVFSAMLMVLKESGSEAYREALPLIGMPEETMPALDRNWMEELLTGMLFRLGDDEEETVKQLRKMLSRIGAIHRRSVYLTSTPAISRALVQSQSKLKAVAETVRLEKEILGDRLRMVILTDYIRADDMPTAPGDEQPLTRIGAVPVFEMLRRTLGDRVKPAILTGSIAVVPATAASRLEGAVPLPHDPSFVRIPVNDANRQGMVAAVTALLEKGEIDVLTGTAALLGEGWDAPCVNSLIMASYVGSYMLSNQMRGRAIRRNPGDPDKTASIWHLVTVDRDAEDGGDDWRSLVRRFRSLAGPGTGRDVIETGIGRLAVGEPPFSMEEIDRLNTEMERRARSRETLRERWMLAVDSGSWMVEEAVLPRRSVPRPFYLDNTLKGLLYVAGFTAAGAAWDAGGWIRQLTDTPFGESTLWGGLAGLAVAAPSFWRAGRLYVRHPSVESSLKEIAEALYAAMLRGGMLAGPAEEGAIRVTDDGQGYYTCWLSAGTTHEKTRFMNALAELLGPIGNPRYLIVRRSRGFGKRLDIHAVPEELGRKKETAEIFLEEWKKRVGRAELIYTRTPEGRRQLLEARMRALSAAFIPEPERISGWR